MSDYSSPLQGNYGYSGDNFGDNQMNASSDAMFYQDNRRDPNQQRSGFNQRRPHDRNRGRNFDRPNYVPYNRGPKQKNYQRPGDGNGYSYFHPSMLENPWAELELKFEKSAANAPKTNFPADSSSSSSDSE